MRQLHRVARFPFDRIIGCHPEPKEVQWSWPSGQHPTDAAAAMKEWMGHAEDCLAPKFDLYGKEAEKFKEQFSFSIVSTKRTLDLEATVEIEARMFINFLRVLLANQKHQEEKFLSKSKIADKTDKANLD